MAVINYPNEHAYTRVTEFKHLTGQEHREDEPWSTSTRRPRATRTIRFRAPENAALYKQYQELAEPTPGVHFVGRLATYKYYNMDQVVAQALTLLPKIAGIRRSECVGA